ncbi:MAG: hypothetical protein IH624_13430 [Phycisphaerae bacterium]|nr:hypothetical protein [Phycisphaerae bacterium]
MERFGYNGWYKMQGVMSCGYPVIALGGLGAMYLFVIRDSGGMFEFEGWVPLAAIGLMGWVAYEVWGLSKRFAFKLCISDEGIQVGDGPVHKWEEISKATCHGMGFGKQAVITLLCASGEELKIPAATDHLKYIQGIIMKKVQVVENAEAS